jgi:parallel beta helix pectate lyase-like protein
MSLSGCLRRCRVGFWIAACTWLNINIPAAEIFTGGDEADFRAAVAAAQDGDTIILMNWLELQATVRISKRITLRPDYPQAYRIAIGGDFEGELLHVTTNGIVLDSMRLYGSQQTDGIRTDADVLLRDCLISRCRYPVVAPDYWSPLQATIRLERTMVSGNQNGLSVLNLEAKDCTFSFNGAAGASAENGSYEGCVFENNPGSGLFVRNGSLKNCVIRYNSEYGLRFDPDNGYMNMEGCLFYANPGGGAYLGEGGYATLDNCTFTRHTGRPAVYVTDAHDIFLRHCTVADNVALGGDDWYSPAAAFWIGSRAKLQNCLIADNPTGDDPNASGLVGDWTDLGGNVIGGPARLGSLRDNGGPTLSLLPLPDSPALDAGRLSDVVRDARGLSRLAGSAPDAGAIERDAAPVADSDSDGLPDVWELFHSLKIDDPSDASADSDRDGQSTLAEYQSGTDPDDRQSVHRMEQIGLDPASMNAVFPRYGYLWWSRYPGINYRVETSSDLRTWRRLPAFGYPEGSTIYGPINADAPLGFFRIIAFKP